MCHVKQQEMISKTGKFQVPAGTRRSTKQPGLMAAESSKPELQPLEKQDHRYSISMKQAEKICQ